MKDSITLSVSRGKNFLHIYHNGVVIGKIEVSELNRGNQASIKFTSDKNNTVVEIKKIEQSTNDIDQDESRFNSERYNK